MTDRISLQALTRFFWQNDIEVTVTRMNIRRGSTIVRFKNEDGYILYDIEQQVITIWMHKGWEEMLTKTHELGKGK